jgi:thiamine-phosphate pyrophosphorylase
LHAVTNDEVLSHPDLDALAHCIGQSGHVALHVRSATLPGRTLVEIAHRLRGTGSQVFINDRADAVAHAGAAGLHLPAAGLSTEDARRLLGDSVFIGRSAHSPAEARAAHDQGADYVFLGPIWETRSHPARQPLGPDAIGEALPARIIAIGGVTPDRAEACRRAGAYGVAAISALWYAPDPAEAATRMLLSFG